MTWCCGRSRGPRGAGPVSTMPALTGDMGCLGGRMPGMEHQNVNYALLLQNTVFARSTYG